MPSADAPRDDDTSPYSHGAVARARDLIEQMPERIGRYRVLERIGHGGMGEVYRVEQRDEIRRELALKLIKLGMDTKQVVARFEAERQALALMDHPHIARVIDAGADDSGRPYFVMELVRGVPITQYADEQRLSIDERLRLFLQVCGAVQHAHQKGIIHRDLKPSNILVSTQDGKPLAKVIDFGIAKATAGRLTDKTLYTEFANFIGTPQYMSPEQAAGSLDIDTRSDVYSLGVLLYELVSGHSPFDPETLRNAALAEVARILREVDPPRPSTRLTTGATKDPAAPSQLSRLATDRSTEPAGLVRQVTGEVDWLVMKAIEKDRSRRYASPADFAEDIERRLAGLPVEAVPPSVGYRLRKLARKHRVPVTLAATTLAALVLVVTGTSYGLLQAKEEAKQKERALAEVTLAKVAAEKARTEALEQKTLTETKNGELERLAYRNGLAMAQQAIDEHAPSVALEVLDECPARLRGWEWRSLREAAVEYNGQMQDTYDRTPFPGEVAESVSLFTYIATASDGRHVICDELQGNAYSALAWVDASTGAIDDACILSHDVYREAISPVEQLVAVVGIQGELSLWSPESDEPAKQIQIFGGSYFKQAPSSLAFASDGRRLAVLSEKIPVDTNPISTVSVYDLPSGDLSLRQVLPCSPVWSKLIGLIDNTVYVLDGEMQRLNCYDMTTDGPQGEFARVSCYDAAFSWRGDLLASVDEEAITIRKIPDMQVVATSRSVHLAHAGEADFGGYRKVVWLPDDSRVVVRGADRFIICDPKVGEILMQPKSQKAEGGLSLDPAWARSRYMGHALGPWSEIPAQVLLEARKQVRRMYDPLIDAAVKRTEILSTSVMNLDEALLAIAADGSITPVERIVQAKLVSRYFNEFPEEASRISSIEEPEEFLAEIVDLNNDRVFEMVVKLLGDDQWASLLAYNPDLHGVSYGLLEAAEKASCVGKSWRDAALCLIVGEHQAAFDIFRKPGVTLTLEREQSAEEYAICLAFRAVAAFECGELQDAKQSIRKSLRYRKAGQLGFVQEEAANWVDPNAMNDPAWTPSSTYTAFTEAIDALELERDGLIEGQEVSVKGFVVRAAPTPKVEGVNLILNKVPAGLRVWIDLRKDLGLGPEILEQVEGKEIVTKGMLKKYVTENKGWSEWEIVLQSAEDLQIIGPNGPEPLPMTTPTADSAAPSPPAPSSTP